MKKPCHECKDPLEPNEQNHVKEYPGKVFCDGCLEELLDAWRIEEYFAGMGACEIFESQSQ